MTITLPEREFLIILTMFSILVSGCLYPFLPKLILKKAHKFELSSDELTKYHAIAVYRYIDEYFSESATKNEDLRKDCKIQAINNANELLLLIKENWVIGEFKLGQIILGKSVEEFIENLSYRLIPNIEHSKTDLILKKTNDILYQLIAFLYVPTKNSLEHINGNMSDQLDPVTMNEENKATKFINFFSSHVILTQAVFIAVIVIAILAVYYSGVAFFKMSTDAAYSLAVNFGGIVFVGYLGIAIIVLQRRNKSLE
jgi:hypothetical protein